MERSFLYFLCTENMPYWHLLGLGSSPFIPGEKSYLRKRGISMSKSNEQFSKNLMEATGPIMYNMTNDYMFRAILQKNKKVLKGLICSLLHLQPNEIISVDITNPIELGTSIEAKDFVLDIKVLLNDSTLINLEMQVENELNWKDRSLVYLCRTFDQLYAGDDYNVAKPAIHIGFLCFTPFKEYPEFYARYRLMNVKNYQVYSDKFELRVVDLKNIELATKEDKQYQIDHWASLFMAKTWEDLKMISQENEFMQEATETLYELNADETIRQQCLARRDYYRTQNSYKKLIDEQAEKIDEQAEKIDEQAKEIEEQKQIILKLQEELKKKEK